MSSSLRPWEMSISICIGDRDSITVRQSHTAIWYSCIAISLVPVSNRHGSIFWILDQSRDHITQSFSLNATSDSSEVLSVLAQYRPNILVSVFVIQADNSMPWNTSACGCREAKTILPGRRECVALSEKFKYVYQPTKLKSSCTYPTPQYTSYMILSLQHIVLSNTCQNFWLMSHKSRL